MVKDKPILVLSNIKVYEIPQPVFQLDPDSFKTLKKERFNKVFSVSTFVGDVLKEESFLKKNEEYKRLNEYVLWFRLGKTNRAGVMWIDKTEFYFLSKKINKILQF